MARGRSAIFGSRSFARAPTPILVASGTPGIPTRTGTFFPGGGPAIHPGQSGTTAPSPNDSSSLFGGIAADLARRAAGAAADRLGAELERRINPPSRREELVAGGANGCPDGRVQIGDQCVDPLAFPPGGEPLTIPAGGEARMGAFGLPAVTPTIVGERNGRPIRQCPTGLVLGKDNMCYAGLPQRFRKWPRKRKPPVTAADMKAIRRAARTSERVKRLAGDVGFTCTPKGRPKRRKKS